MSFMEWFLWKEGKTIDTQLALRLLGGDVVEFGHHGDGLTAARGRAGDPQGAAAQRRRAGRRTTGCREGERPAAARVCTGDLCVHERPTSCCVWCVVRISAENPDSNRLLSVAAELLPVSKRRQDPQPTFEKTDFPR
ncbi:hypothetical protein RB628_26715 [Streptomyces sp. ADMS]|uniref:hypothetical protein n=1 Tax=Streptomyces sp. ADMS TaxID=3071415 RepID=UPI00296EE14E|nr:hypothetical protein [Streptomyces sp. ADMS]MDW4908836.1 hypothetical protein [Streptomyces sp. ADMS]